MAVPSYLAEVTQPVSHSTGLGTLEYNPFLSTSGEMALTHLAAHCYPHIRLGSEQFIAEA